VVWPPILTGRADSTVARTAAKMTICGGFNGRTDIRFGDSVGFPFAPFWKGWQSMNIGEILYFSPRFRFSEIDFNDAGKLIGAFRDRVEGFYLEPARRLVQAGDAFACGLLCCASMDFLARYQGVGGSRITEWLKKNVPEFDEPDPQDGRRTLACRFEVDFRNGLDHEGRIKNLGQFSLDQQTVLRFVDSGMIVNPRLLLEAIRAAFAKYCTHLQSDQGSLQNLISRLKSDFSQEIAASKSG